MRPIIVIDLSGYASAMMSSSSSSSNDEIEGIYLPLERPSADCCKSPIFLCYRENHFCPLLFKSSQSNEAVVPLNRGDFSVLPVRYTKDHESTTHALQEYLNVKEVDFSLPNGSTVSLLCSLMSMLPLPEQMNSVNSHLRKCQMIFQDFLAAEKQRREKHNLYMPPLQSQQSPFQYVDESNQTYVIPITGRNKENNLSSSSSLSHPMTMMHVTPSSPSVTFVNHEMSTTEMNEQTPKMESNLQVFIPIDRAGSSLENSKSPKISRNNECKTPGCFNERDIDIGDLCYICFKKATVEESGLELMSINDGGKHRYIMQHAQTSRRDIDNTKKMTSPVRNEEENLRAYSELTSYPLLTAANESCLHSSDHSHFPSNNPLGHQSICKTSEKDRVEISPTPSQAGSGKKFVNATNKETFRHIVYHPPTNIVARTQYNLPSRSDEDEKTQASHHLCQSEGCQNQKQLNSKWCSSCLMQRNSHASDFVQNSQMIQTAEQPPRKHTKSQLQFGQAECLSSPSDEGVIEVSAAPLFKQHKCSNHLCQVEIPASQGLCEKCQNILISHFKNAAPANTNDQMAKNDWQNQQTLSAYRSGTLSSVMASASPSKDRQVQRVHSERIKSVSNSNSEDFRQKKDPYRDHESRFDLRTSASFDVEARQQRMNSFLDPNFQSSSPALAVSVEESVPKSTEVTQPSSYSKAVDSEFHQMYMRLQKEHQKSLDKCHTEFCQNFGNKRKGGYCNACFSALTENDKHNAIFGKRR